MLRCLVASPFNHGHDLAAEFFLGLLERDVAQRCGVGKRLGSAEHCAQPGGAERGADGEGLQGVATAFQEDCLVVAFGSFKLRRAGQGRDDAGYFTPLALDAVDVGRGNDFGARVQVGRGGCQGLAHQLALALIVVSVQRCQEYGPSLEMIVDHGFGDAGLFRQMPQSQGLGALFANDLPGHRHQLLQSLLPRQASTRRGIGFLAA